MIYILAGKPASGGLSYLLRSILYLTLEHQLDIQTMHGVQKS